MAPTTSAADPAPRARANASADPATRGARRQAARQTRRVIITADDFGRHESVNEAVESAHRDGVLTTASLMITAPAAADAVARARALPRLAVGLHLTLTDGRPALPAARVPALLRADGAFDDAMVRAGCRFFFSPRARRQLGDEIRAQFAAFAASGLTLDHVNAHKHFHLHPSVTDLIVAIGRDYGLPAVRVPAEPLGASLRVTRRRCAHRVAGTVGLAPWQARMRRRLRRAGICTSDHVFGLATSGRTRPATMIRILQALPPGLSEVYLHPATRNGFSPLIPDYDHRGEWQALTAPAVRAALARLAIRPTTFSAAARAAA